MGREREVRVKGVFTLGECETLVGGDVGRIVDRYSREWIE